MIRGMHALFYSSEADALRIFLRDKLGLAAADVGGEDVNRRLAGQRAEATRPPEQRRSPSAATISVRP